MGFRIWVMVLEVLFESNHFIRWVEAIRGGLETTSFDEERKSPLNEFEIFLTCFKYILKIIFICILFLIMYNYF